MNSHGTKPPDKHQSGHILAENESILCGIKLEPIIKEETKKDDNIVTVSRTTHTADGVTLDNSIGDTAMNGNDNFTDLVGLTETKSGVKLEKVKEDVEQGPQKSNDKNQTEGMMNRFSKGKNPQSTGLDGGARKGVTASAGKANRKIHKCSSFDDGTNRKCHLKKYMPRHTGERPFPFSFCQKRFIQKNNQLYMKIYVDEFMFSCSNCSQGFHHSVDKVEHEEVDKCLDHSTHNRIHKLYVISKSDKNYFSD